MHTVDFNRNSFVIYVRSIYIYMHGTVGNALKLSWNRYFMLKKATESIKYKSKFNLKKNFRVNIEFLLAKTPTDQFVWYKHDDYN